MRGFLPDLFKFSYEEIRPLATRHSPISRFVVLIWGANPTFDYYIQPRLGETPAVIVDLSAPRSAHNVHLQPGDYVLACRYLDWHWSRRITAARDISGVGLLLDDDYVAFFGDRSIPLLYRLDVARRSMLPLRMIRHRLTDVLVSTKVLQERFNHASAIVVRPSPSPEDLAALPPRAGGVVRIAFHAQLSHLGDHAFAAEIAQALVHAMPAGIVFDVVGPTSAKGIWARVASAQFHSELSWPEYRNRCREVRSDILIAPMFDTPLNQARSPSKAIDAVRMGAAAVFPRSRPYQELEESCVLVDGGPADWVSALRNLIETRDRLRWQADCLKAEMACWAAKALPLWSVLR